MTFFLVSLIAALSTGLFYSVRISLSYSEKFDEMQEVIQESIKVLNDQYAVIDKKTKLEVFFDEPVVKDLVQDIAIARDSVLSVAKALDSTLEVDSPEEQGEET